MQSSSWMRSGAWRALAVLAASSCTDVSSTPSVEFGTGSPVGLWPNEAPVSAGSGASAHSAGASGHSTLPPLANAGTSGPNAQLTAGQPSVANTGTTTAEGGTGSPGSAGARATAGSTVGGMAGRSSAAGSGGSLEPADAGVPAAISGATSLTFDVTTSAVGGRYQPRNIGAIWVQDANGKLVKSLEVWAAIRRRYLTRYASALSLAAVDVTSSATLSSHRTHHATWKMTDRSGSTVAPGKYTLVIELTDGDMTGRSTTVDFDTSAGAQTLMPTDAPSFSAMKVQLQ